jgi:hypothetical protein
MNLIRNHRLRQTQFAHFEKRKKIIYVLVFFTTEAFRQHICSWQRTSHSSGSCVGDCVPQGLFFFFFGVPVTAVRARPHNLKKWTRLIELCSVWSEV